MDTYIDTGDSLRTPDGLTVIPKNSNWRYQQALDDVEAGRAEIVPPPEPTMEEVMKSAQTQFTNAIQARLDAFARTRNYDGILSATTYATSTNTQFKGEGQYAVEARDATWAAGYAILGDVLAGKRPMPTLEEVLAELPELQWPGEEASPNDVPQ